jgi:RNA polymerase sigma-70 factor (ECF subfamily)
LRRALSTNTPVSEIELMQRVSESDLKAIEILYDKYAELLFTFTKKIIRDKDLSEEILCEVFFLLYKKINYFNFNTKNAYSWLINLTKNRAVYELKKRRNSVPDKENLQGHEIDYIIPRLSHIIEPLNLEKALKLKNKVEAALNNLTDAQQFVIYHAFYEGLTQEEIAQKLKIPVTTVQSKVRTSLISFNEKLTDKPQIFSVQNESIELIYPYVLGCLSNEEQLKTYNTFKASEPFPWKTLGDYQNLVSLLPIILDLEEPPQQLR